MSTPTTQPVPASYDAVIEKIRAGVLRGKGVALAAEDITDATTLWPGGDPSQPCLSFDSIDFLELVVFFEDEYGWVIPETDIDVHECRTVGDLATLVIKNVHGAP